MVTQKQVDEFFYLHLGSGNLQDDYYEDCKKIQKVLNQKFNVNLSIAECAKFWEWRSNEFDASWLIVHNKSDSEIKEWFLNYMKDFLENET